MTGVDPETELETLRRHLDALAESSDDDLMTRYRLRPAPRPPGLYWQLRWLAARVLRGLETIGIKRPRPWPAALKHAPAGIGARPLLIWAMGSDRDALREACRGFVELQGALPGFAPVLVTDVADFAFFSRLGWLVEYVPKLSGAGEPYQERKARFLARLYRGAPALPVSAGLGMSARREEIRRWIENRVAVRA